METQAWLSWEGKAEAGGRTPGPGGVKPRVRGPGQEAGRGQWAGPSRSSLASPLPSDPDHGPVEAAGGWEPRLGHPAAPRPGHCPRQWRLHILHQVRTLLPELLARAAVLPGWHGRQGEGVLGAHLWISPSVSSLSQTTGKIPLRLLGLPFLQPHHCGVRLQQPTV